MYLTGINFILHFKALRGDFRAMLSNHEFKFYNVVVFSTIFSIAIVLFLNGPAPIESARDSYRNQPMTTTEFDQHYEKEHDKVLGISNSVRIAAFQTLSIATTTGFATADFDLWPDFLRFLLVLLMFIGGCAGSTAGGLKMIRVMIIGRVALNVLRKLTQPRLVAPVKIGNRPVDEQLIVNIVSFFILFIGLFILTAGLMTLFVPDLTTAVVCSVATICNIGPGLAGIGAIENYGWIAIPGKWILIISMLLGRLEIFTVLIVLRPSVWRK